MSFEIRHGDVLDRLAEMPESSVDCVVTSPPYWGLRNYGIPDRVWGGDPAHEHVWGELISVNSTNHTDKRRWDHTRNGRGEEQPKEKQVAWLRTEVGQGPFCECGAWRGCLGLEPTPYLFVEHIVLVFEAVKRVLRPEGTLWLNLGDSYATGAGKASSPGGGVQGQRFLESGPSGYRGSHSDSPKHAMGPQPGFQPNRMPIPGLKPKDLVGVPWRCAFALQDDGWWLRSDIIWAKPAPMPESVTDRPTRSHEYVFLLAKSQKYFYDHEAIKEPSVCSHSSGNGYKRDARLTYSDGSAARGSDEPWQPANYKGSSFTKGKTKTAREQTGAKVGEKPRNESATRNKRDVWTINTQPTPEAHFATFPIALAETCILAGTPPPRRSSRSLRRRWYHGARRTKARSQLHWYRTQPGVCENCRVSAGAEDAAIRMTLRPGWLERQIKDTNDDIATWPAWMRREAGFAGAKFMTEKKVRCDACGQPAVEIRYDYDRVPDAAGGMDTEYKTVDLCVKHLQERLQIFLQEPSKAPVECGKQAFSRWAQGLTWKP